MQRNLNQQSPELEALDKTTDQAFYLPEAQVIVAFGGAISSKNAFLQNFVVEIWGIAQSGPKGRSQGLLAVSSTRV